MKAASVFRLSLIGLAALLALVPQAAIFAGAPVDPSTLNPPPPPQFNPICNATGFGTLCDVAFSDGYVDQDSGVVCPGPTPFEVLDTQSRSVNGRRYYDQNNNLDERHYQEVLSGTFKNSLTGKTINYAGQDTVVQRLSTPGDINSGTYTISGLQRFYLPNGGTALINAGRVINDGSGNLLEQHGQQPFNRYFAYGDTAALQPLCDALK